MKPLLTHHLKHPFTIERSTQVKDGKGGYTTSWTPIAKGKCELEGKTGRESVMEQALEGISVYQLRIRWRAGLEILPKDQITTRSLILNVRSAVDPDGKREQILILADTASTEPVT